MEEQKEHLKIYSLLQWLLYFFVALDIIMHLYLKHHLLGVFNMPLERMQGLAVFDVPVYTKLFTLLLICIVGVGTLARKNLEADPKKHVVFPLVLGLILLFGSLIFLYEANHSNIEYILPYTNVYGVLYILVSIVGALLTMISID